MAWLISLSGLTIPLRPSVYYVFETLGTALLSAASKDFLDRNKNDQTRECQLFQVISS